MKKSFFKMRATSLCKATLFGIATVALAGLAACSNDDINPNLSSEEVTETRVGTPVNVVNDPDVLSQYVTNYKKAGNPGAMRISRQEEDIVSSAMPAIYDENDKPFSVEEKYQLYDGHNWGTTEGGVYIVPAGKSYTADYGLGFNGNNSGQVDLIVYGTLIVQKGFSMDASKTSEDRPFGSRIIVAPTGTFKMEGNDWNGNQLGAFLTVSHMAMYIYEDATVDADLSTSNGAGLFVQGDLKLASMNDGETEYSGKNLNIGGPAYIGGTLTCASFETNNATLQAGSVMANSWLYTNDSKVNVKELIAITGDYTINAQNKIECENLIVDGNFNMKDKSNLEAYEHIEVLGDFTVATQGVVYTPCLYVEEDLKITNSGTLNIPNYIHCTNLTAPASGFSINMGGDALIYCENGDFTIENKGWSVAFDNDEDSWSAIVANKFQIMEGNVSYMTGYATLSASEGYWDKSGTNFQYYTDEVNTAVNRSTYEAQTTVSIEPNSVEVQNPDGCEPSFKTDTPPTPPVITELISTIAHTHDVSATCVALNADKTKAYLSWQKRGTSIHGCLEALVVENDEAKLTSYMECDNDDVEGGDNWNGNSAVSGADENDESQGQYDFNHLIVAEGHVVTVGDNANMGGFIGGIALDGNGDFGESLAVNGGFFARQLLASAEGDNIARSGNTVVYNNGKYYIACAGGFQEYIGSIADLAIWNNYKNPTDPTKLGYWATKLGNSRLTDGSAKHIAISGDKVATLELVSRPTAEGDYFFNDNTTAIDGKLRVSSTGNWLGDADWTATITGICPVYGKNTIAFDGDNVYVCAGKAGLQVWNNGTLVNKFDGTNAKVVEVLGKGAEHAGANGVAIDENYVYVAFGTGGVWILNKSDLSVVSWYKSNGATNYGTDFASEAEVAAANYIALDGTYIYVAYGRHGIKVLKLE